MAAGPMPPQAPAQAPAQDPAQGSGGDAAQAFADAHSSLMKCMDIIGDKLPDESKALGQVIQQFESVVESLGQPAGAKPQGPPQPGTTSPEAGGADVQQAY